MGQGRGRFKEDGRKRVWESWRRKGREKEFMNNQTSEQLTSQGH